MTTVMTYVDNDFIFLPSLMTWKMLENEHVIWNNFQLVEVYRSTVCQHLQFEWFCEFPICKKLVVDRVPKSYGSTYI